jgi:hypothetical protein
MPIPRRQKFGKKKARSGIPGGPSRLKISKNHFKKS